MKHSPKQDTPMSKKLQARLVIDRKRYEILPVKVLPTTIQAPQRYSTPEPASPRGRNTRHPVSNAFPSPNPYICSLHSSGTTCSFHANSTCSIYTNSRLQEDLKPFTSIKMGREHKASCSQASRTAKDRICSDSLHYGTDGSPTPTKPASGIKLKITRGKISCTNNPAPSPTTNRPRPIVLSSFLGSMIAPPQRRNSK